MACQKGYIDVVLTLLGAGAGVNIARSIVSDVLTYNDELRNNKRSTSGIQQITSDLYTLCLLVITSHV